MRYYYEGCASWSWFYPYHYAPLAADIVQPQRVPLAFALGTPFHPFEQLLAVLPARRYAARPVCPFTLSRIVFLRSRICVLLHASASLEFC
jgi:5'-3' exonuclease